MQAHPLCAECLRSLPVRGAWVEICRRIRCARNVCGRSPCGERGLKSVRMLTLLAVTTSLPVRGAWIEM